MPKFRKKPIVIEAIQLDMVEAYKDTGEAWWSFVYRWAENLGADTSKWVACSKDGIKIPTLEGVMLAKPDDWIIRGVSGEFYPCKPDIFDATYDAA